MKKRERGSVAMTRRMETAVRRTEHIPGPSSHLDLSLSEPDIITELGPGCEDPLN